LGGVLTAGATQAMLVGNGSGTTFFNLGLSNFTYKKNRTEYAQSDQQAPMNVFALVYAQSTAGISFNSIQIGKDRNFLGRFAKLDIGDVALWDAPTPLSVIREASEALIMKWGL
jgi:hypothetical protein